MTKGEIEQEVQARVEFKINEILDICNNQVGLNWERAFQRGEPRYQHYMEAWKEFREIVKKEASMPVPSDNMYLKKMDLFKDELLNPFMGYLREKLRGRFDPRDLEAIARKSVDMVEKAMKFK